MNDLNALLLCGGKSSRLGFDKIGVLKDSIPLYLWWKKLFTELNLPFYYSCNKQIQAKYNLDCCYTDIEEYTGPLGGMLSYIQNNMSTPVVCVAADLVYINKSDVEKLLDNRDKDKAATCFIQSNQNKIYPLFSIIETKLFEKLIHEYNTSTRSIQKVLESSDIKVLNNSPNLSGLNTIEDFTRFQNKKSNQF
ncbi:MAG: NTP transferase domain-containing protein [Saprospiraceae bacterium]|nr:NTP transferase domain-containing protein [Saprospiraceae bacterium]